MRAAIAITTLTAIGLSLPLWLNRPAYPASPVWSFVPAFPPPIDAVFLTIVFAVFTLVLWRPTPRPLAVLWLAGVAFLILQDQARLQPWFVHAALIVVALVFSKDERAALNNCRLITASVYFWSGAHKMNTSFVDALFPWLLSPITRSASTAHAVGSVVPYLEMGMAVALLVPRVRQIGVIGIVAMHVFLLGVLGPWALNWNIVVWPWNFMMLAVVPTLFWRTRVPMRDLVAPRGPGMRVALLTVLVILPALSLGEWWDTAPSFDLYSGNPLLGSVVMTRDAWQRLDPKVRGVAEQSTAGYRIRFDDWSISERKVPAYPAERVLSHVAQSFCSVHRAKNDVVFLIEKPARWLYRPGWHRVEDLTCR